MDTDKMQKRRIQNMRTLAARYETQADLAKALGWTPSYLSQLVGPNPSRTLTDRSARWIEAELKLPSGVLDQEVSPMQTLQSLHTGKTEVVSADLLDNVMVAVDTAMELAGWKLSDEKYRALISHLYKAAIKRGATQVDRDEVDTLLRLVR
jgi:transcriptional regulator with XRE-family HTH domain